MTKQFTYSFSKIILLFICLAAFQPASAQEGWTLQQCIEYAIKNNVQLKINALSIEANQANLIQSKMARMPNLNAGFNQGWNFGRNVDPFTNQFTNDPVSSNNYQLSSSITVFNGFRQTNTIKQNQMLLEASQFDNQKAKNDLTLNLINSYITIVFNRELLGVAKLQLANTQEQLDRTLKLIEAGSLPEVNKFNLLSQKANDEMNVTTAENNIALATLRLQQFMQMPADQKFDIVIPKVDDPQGQVLKMPAMEIYTAAESTQPDVKSADLNIKSSETGIEIAKGNAYPSLRIDASILTGYSSQGIRVIPSGERMIIPIGYLADDIKRLVVTEVAGTPSREKSPYGSQLDQNLRQNLSFTLNVPIFNRYQVKNAVANAQIQRDRAKLNSQNVRNQLRQNIEQAYADALAANKSFQSNKVRVDALDQTLKVTEQRFNLGAANATDYSVAKDNLSMAQSDLIRAKYNYLLRVKILDFYAGNPLDL